MVFFSSSFKSTNQLSGIAKRCACCMWHQDLIDEDECYVVSWLHIETHCSVYPWFASKLWDATKGLSNRTLKKRSVFKPCIVQGPWKTALSRPANCGSCGSSQHGWKYNQLSWWYKNCWNGGSRRDNDISTDIPRAHASGQKFCLWWSSHDLTVMTFSVFFSMFFALAENAGVSHTSRCLKSTRHRAKGCKRGIGGSDPPPKNVQTWCRWLNLQLLETMMRCKNIFRRYRHGLSGNCFLCWAWNAQGQVSGRFFVPTVWVLCNLPVQAGVNPNYFKGLESAFAYFLSDLM